LADIVKALAFGATAVAIGRRYAYGLAHVLDPAGAARMSDFVRRSCGPLFGRAAALASLDRLAAGAARHLAATS
jgi:hypothetical protein